MVNRGRSEIISDQFFPTILPCAFGAHLNAHSARTRCARGATAYSVPPKGRIKIHGAGSAVRSTTTSPLKRLSYLKPLQIAGRSRRYRNCGLPKIGESKRWTLRCLRTNISNPELGLSPPSDELKGTSIVRAPCGYQPGDLAAGTATTWHMLMISEVILFTTAWHLCARFDRTAYSVK